jgi:hypothetical protein
LKRESSRVPCKIQLSRRGPVIVAISAVQGGYGKYT